MWNWETGAEWLVYSGRLAAEDALVANAYVLAEINLALQLRAARCPLPAAERTSGVTPVCWSIGSKSPAECAASVDLDVRRLWRGENFSHRLNGLLRRA